MTRGIRRPAQEEFVIPTIRQEVVNDRDAVDEVNRLAFGGPDETRLVQALRQSDAFISELSLVAEKDGTIAGHILFSPITIETKTGAVAALSLAPMAVLPELQRQEIGSELVRRGLERCRALGHEIVIVLGHSAYYPRFGFTPARAMGIECPFPASDESFMAIELVPGALDGVEGTVKYPPEFDEVT